MALAILELDSIGKDGARFRIDTGTNRYYQLKLGRGVRRKGGIDWVDEVFFSTPIGSNTAGGSLLDSRKNVSVPIKVFDRGNIYVQLFSFKNAVGKSPGFSDVLDLPAGSAALAAIPVDFALPSSIPVEMITVPFNAPHSLPCRTCAEAYAQQASIEELLGSIAKVAVPIVTGFLGGAQGGATPAVATAPGGASTAGAGVASPPTAAQGEDLMRLLNIILGSIISAGGGMSQPQSLLTGQARDNRFAAMQSAEYSQAFIAPALLAFLGPLIDGVVKVLPGVIGPIAQNAPQFLREFNQHLPMLINAINQREIQAEAADKKMATDMLADVNRTTLIEQFLRSQQPASASGQVGDVAALGQLIQLLQQSAAIPATAAVAPAAVAAAPLAAPANVAAAQSLSQQPGSSPAPSNRAVLTFSHEAPVMWNGTERLLFARDRGLQLKLRLHVTAPVPGSPLPKAILKLVFKDAADKSVLLEKSFKQKGWAPNSEMSFAVGADEVAHLPVNRILKVFAELRWPRGASARESAALGSTEIVLVNKYFVKQQGAAVSAERELKDMNRFRPFWNKVWEAPVVDETGNRRERSRQVLWSLDINARYSVLLSADRDANGVMETRLLKEKVDEDDIGARTNGRLKGGIELSIAELNKLLPLWDAAPMLERDKLEAFVTRPLAAGNAMEFVYNMKLRGKAGQRGMVWVVPTFKLFEFTLGGVGDIDEAGQVIGVSEEKVRFPLPVSARVIGLRSEH